MRIPRILVMDPSETVRSHYLEALTAQGLQAEGCATAAATLTRHEGLVADVVVVDCPVDDLEAEQLVRDLLNIPSSRAGIIKLRSDGPVESADHEPRVKILAKPDDPAVLVHEVLGLLQGTATEAAARVSDATPTVLIVDDSPTFRMAMRGLLAPHWNIIEAASGVEAVLRVATTAVDAVLLDIGLPDIRGTEVCREIRLKEQSRTLPIIMLTAADDDEIVLASFEAGADDYVVKGCRSEVLLARIGSHVRRRRTELAMHQAALDLRTAEAVSAVRADLLAQVNRQAEELQRINEELERFAAVAAHDLQEPLRLITNYLDLLQRRYAERFDGKAREYFSVVTNGALRMRSLIQSFLDFSKVDQLKGGMGEVESAGALEDALTNLAEKIRESGAVVTAGPLPNVHSSRILLSQLFQNLIGNGIKFSARQPAIAISAVDQGDEWHFAVTDNGIGIPVGDRHRLFKTFQRLHRPEEYAGTGIGLATCKKIVGLHGGRIWIESSVGVGSTFFFSLPKSGGNA